MFNLGWGKAKTQVADQTFCSIVERWFYGIQVVNIRRVTFNQIKYQLKIGYVCLVWVWLVIAMSSETNVQALGLQNSSSRRIAHSRYIPVYPSSILSIVGL